MREVKKASLHTHTHTHTHTRHVIGVGGTKIRRDTLHFLINCTTDFPCLGHGDDAAVDLFRPLKVQ